MSANKPADVKIIQACLSGIKVKMKPLFKGKADGKAGKDLIDAICTFQCVEKIKQTGKIMPGDSTSLKLKMRTPSAVSGQLRTTSVWRQPTPGKLRVVTGQSFEFLKNLGLPSAEWMEKQGIEQADLDPVALKLHAATEKAEKEGLL